MKKKFKKLEKRELQILFWTVLGIVGLIIFGVLLIKGGL